MSDPHGELPVSVASREQERLARAFNSFTATVTSPVKDRDGSFSETTLVDQLLAEQQTLTAVERFSQRHDRGVVGERYSALLPARPPGPGEQYAFEVNLDACTGCKACVVACHSLNGLDDDEAWRDVGLLLGGRKSAAYQQTVTSACHHCEDPACMNGCPVGAYEKEADTGVVKHLDDQCIGCGYCVLKCPYDVPKYNERLGIVRKCDMCVGRIREGEAPACVQACPTSAISIRVVKVGSTLTTAKIENLVPGAFDSAYTRPTTRYISTRTMPSNTRPADAELLRLEHAHWPLIVMLVLSQLSVGMFVVMAVIGAHSNCVYVATAALQIGLGASVLHLGRPMGAWRFFLGLRKSWMSREILAFSLFAMMSMGVAALTCFTDAKSAGLIVRLALMATALLGLLAVFTSAMIYIDTQRPFWKAKLTHGKFFGGTLAMGLAAMSVFIPSLLLPAMLAHAMLFAWVQKQNRCAFEDEECAWHMSARVMKLRLIGVMSLSEAQMPLFVAFGTLAIAFDSMVCAVIMVGLSVFAVVLERYTFFVASMGLKMPGGFRA